MATKLVGDNNDEELKKLLDSDNNYMDFSDLESNEYFNDSSSESSDDSSEANDDALWPSTCVRCAPQKQSEWNWKKIKNDSVIYLFSGNTKICKSY